MNKFPVMLALAGLAVSGATAAQAQNPTGAAAAALGFKVAKPVRIQIGEYFPTDSSLKDGVSKNFTRYGLAYDVWKSPILVPVVVGGYVDGVLPKDRDVAGGKNSFSMVGVGAQARMYFNPPLLPVSFFGGLAAGPYFVHAKILDQSENKTVFGGKVFVGAEFASTLYGTIDYTYLSKVSAGNGEYKPSGFGASVGVRF